MLIARNPIGAVPFFIDDDAVLAQAVAFAIVNYYRGPRPFAHFDLYRISTENDLCAAGFYDYLDEGAVVAAEWSENFADLLALEDPIHINIERVDDTTRRMLSTVC